MKVIIAGGRNFIAHNQHKKWLKTELKKLGVSEIVTGGAKGADGFGLEIAFELYIPAKVFKPLWALHGKAAGPIRNAEMAAYADACITFPGGKGTASMEELARRAGIQVIRWVDRK
jgi:hypothetical protein